MDKFKAVLRLTRIEHSLLLMVAVVAAELIAGGIPAIPILVLSLLTPFFVSAGAFAINDYFDVEADRKNKRSGRPLVAGALTKKQARYIAYFCFIVGAACSLFGLYPFIIAVVFCLISYLYSYRLKDVLLVGNSCVALSMVIPFVYGNFVVSSSLNLNILLVCFVIFLSGLAREIHGMIRDRVGDVSARGSKNLVRYVGPRTSAWIALVLYLEAIMISLFMFFYMLPFRYNLIYIAPVVLVDLIFVYVSVGYLTKGNRRFFDLARNLSLAGMGLALLAYLFSALVYLAV